MCENALKTSVLEMVNDLKLNFTDPESVTDLMNSEFYFKKIKKEKLMAHVIDRVLPFKGQIEKEEEIFFVKNTDKIFGGLPPDRITFFSNRLISLPPDDKKTLWRYFQTFVALAEMHKKKK